MLIRRFSALPLFICRALHPINRRSYYSSRITSLFVQNFDKFQSRISEKNKDGANDLGRLLNEYNELRETIHEVEKELNNPAADKDLQELMKDEKLELENRLIDEITPRLLDEIHSYEISKDEKSHDSSPILFEIAAGVGGKEAMLFANELSELYLNFFNYKRWTTKDLEADEERGNFRAKIEGANVWGVMRFEAGVHRVQRVPETEAKGRVHTSTVSVACIPMNEKVKVEIDEKDLKIQTKTATGAGGQHVNKTESAIRLTHVPTGIIVECQEDRSQIKNRKIALEKLQRILTDRFLSENFEKTRKTKKSQIGKANRNEKIRTYNFKDDRVTDHRISALNLSPHEKEDSIFGLDSFFSNPERLDGLIKNLSKVEKESELMEILSDLDRRK